MKLLGRLLSTRNSIILDFSKQNILNFEQRYLTQEHYLLSYSLPFLTHKICIETIQQLVPLQLIDYWLAVHIENAYKDEASTVNELYNKRVQYQHRNISKYL